MASAALHRDRYFLAVHAMQSAVAYTLTKDIESGKTAESRETSPKHLRTGLNAAMVEHGALVSILIKKGLFTEEEYFEALANLMEREVETYRVKLGVPENVKFG